MTHYWLGFVCGVLAWPLVELVEATGERQEDRRKELWKRLCRLALAQKKFCEANLAMNQPPDWQGALR